MAIKRNNLREEAAETRPKAPAGPGRAEQSVWRRLSQSSLLWAVVMLAPLFAGLLIFYHWPVALTFYYSFTEWTGFGNYDWAWLENYREAVGDPDVYQAARNTLIFTFLSVPISVFLAIIVATLLNQNIKGIVIYRTLYFIPVVTMPAAVALIWSWLYNADFGLLNFVLERIGIDGPRWLSGDLALYSLVAVQVWMTVGYNTIILLSGLQGIPGYVYEAAAIDGASPLAQFFRITIPLLTPTIFFVAVIGLINAFQVFDLIVLMIGSNSPAIDNTQSLVYLFYNEGFVQGDRGYGAVIVLILFVMIFVATALSFWMQRRWVYYTE